MRRMMLVFLAGVTLLTIMVAASVVWQDSDKPARATPGLVVGFDMDPTGNSCPNNASGPDCTLGSVEACVQVAAGDVLQFDVFVDGLPSGENIAGFGYNISGFPGTLTAQTHNDGAINLLAQPGSTIMDFSEGLPDPPGGGLPPHTVGVADLGFAESNPPFTKGVLGRYTLDVTGVSPGVYGLVLDSVNVGNEDAKDLCWLYGCEIRDANFSPYYGVIAVDVPCGSAPPITPTPTPTVSPTLTPTPTATPTGTPTPPGLVAGWNHVCYLGAELPVSEALADLGTSVLAVYHLRPGQGYEKWLPGRPDMSDMETVRPYEPLFILMANDVAWAQQPVGTPPANLDLAEGWNSACYSGETKDVESATTSIGGQYAVLYLLEANQGWKRFIPGRTDISDLAELQRFAAVLILVTQPEGAHWVFDP